jgi:2-polyprenyl-3-methyl-5-hydroxy-6-metoxy-1,4-benzoquinol methylase
MSQNKHYSDFARKYKEEIINCPDPAVWTTDISNNGPISARMKIRTDTLKKLINEHFTKEYRIFDIGCGFGRQSFLLAKEGFEITGVDTNRDFINIAVEIFKKHFLKGSFFCSNLGNRFTDEKFQQVILLEVLEHIPPYSRKKFIKLLYSYCHRNTKLIVSIPKMKATFKMSLYNFSKYFLSPFIKEEHPYPIPSEKSIARILGNLFHVSAKVTHEETIFFICKSSH